MMSSTSSKTVFVSCLRVTWNRLHFSNWGSRLHNHWNSRRPKISQQLTQKWAMKFLVGKRCGLGCVELSYNEDRNWKSNHPHWQPGSRLGSKLIAQPYLLRIRKPIKQLNCYPQPWNWTRVDWHSRKHVRSILEYLSSICSGMGPCEGLAMENDYRAFPKVPVGTWPNFS